MKIYILQAVKPSKNLSYETGYPPLGVAYCAAYLRQRMPDVEFVVRNQWEAKDVLAVKPDMLAITSVTQNFDMARNIAKEVKEKLGIPIVVVGEHISCIPDNLPSGADVAVLREGELGFYEVVKAWREDGAFKPASLQKILGISYWDRAEGRVKVTAPRPSIENLDEIPFPARDLFPPGPQLMFTARGCSYRCKFCSSAAFWETIRFFTPERVLSEVQSILEIDPSTKSILIFDDLFAAKKERMNVIADLLAGAGIPQRVSFWADSTANMIIEPICGALKKMNMDGISFGFESGNNELIQWLKGKWTGLATNYKAIELCNKYGIQAHGSFMLGLPDETEQQMMETLHFIKTANYDKGGIAVCTPLPGTPFWEIGLKKGLVVNHMERWEDLTLRTDSWFPENDEGYVLMTDRVPRRIFREIFEDCAREIRRRQAIYEEKRAEINARRLRFKDFFSRANIGRALKDPRRAARYARKFIRQKVTNALRPAPAVPATALPN